MWEKRAASREKERAVRPIKSTSRLAADPAGLTSAVRLFYFFLLFIISEMKTSQDFEQRSDLF